MPKALILITVDSGTDTEVVQEIKNMINVKEIYEVYGAYDIIVMVQGDSDAKIKETVFNKIRQLETVDLVYAAKKIISESKNKSNNLSNNNINLEEKIDKKQLELTLYNLKREGLTNKLDLKDNFRRFLFLLSRLLI